MAQLYKETSASVYGYALSILKNTYDAEDVLQNCYIHVYNSAHTYKSVGKPLAWILTITRNLCLEYLRKQTRESVMADEDWESYFNSNEHISYENRVVLSECMKILSDTERQVIVLHAVSGFKHREIASIMEIPLSTVLSKYNRAIKKLKAAFEKGE